MKVSTSSLKEKIVYLLKHVTGDIALSEIGRLLHIPSDSSFFVCTVKNLHIEGTVEFTSTDPVKIKLVKKEEKIPLSKAEESIEWIRALEKTVPEGKKPYSPFESYVEQEYRNSLLREDAEKMISQLEAEILQERAIYEEQINVLSTQFKSKLSGSLEKDTHITLLYEIGLQNSEEKINQKKKLFKMAATWFCEMLTRKNYEYEIYSGLSFNPKNPCVSYTINITL